ncbi:MAG: hypothetical protein KDA41_17410, partial [Planctomycetales bacterium]|nr:hypothetical protein [Planctomycetales bacterium]
AWQRRVPPMGKITGADKHERRLRNMRAAGAARQLTAAVFAEAQELQVDAQLSITRGAVSGKNHVPSAPGEPPNNDTGVLAGNIEANVTGVAKAETSSNAPYAAIHEFGGTIDHPGGTPYFMRDGKPVFVSNSGQGAFHTLPVTKPHKITMPERPYLRPAAARAKERFPQAIADAVKKVVRSVKG